MKNWIRFCWSVVGERVKVDNDSTRVASEVGVEVWGMKGWIWVTRVGRQVWR